MCVCVMYRRQHVLYLSEFKINPEQSVARRMIRLIEMDGPAPVVTKLALHSLDTLAQRDLLEEFIWLRFLV